MNSPLKKPQQRPTLAVQKCIADNCAAEYEINEQIYACRKCGETLEIDCRADGLSDLAALRQKWQARAISSDPWDRSGVWRYREVLPFTADAPIVTLFEGNTPLYQAPKCANYAGLASLTLKHQGTNPTGSFKDTGMTTAATQAVILSARAIVCASTGNTAASLAAYAARAKVKCVVLLPANQVTLAKLAQSMDYGAVILEVAGNFDDCMRLTHELSDIPWIYVANSINPFRIEGQKTVAYELMSQRDWQVPDHLVVPGGNMGNSSALGKGFEEMRRMGLIDRVPRLSIIQAEGAAPLARLFSSLAPADGESAKSHLAKIEAVADPRTLANAIRIGAPVSWRQALSAVLRSHGEIIAVTERELADAKAMIGLEGIGCEPASAATVAGIKKLVAQSKIHKDESVVGILTGHVLKDPDYVSHYHRGTLSFDAGASGPGEKASLIPGGFRNSPVRVAATKEAIVKSLQQGL